MYEYKANPSLDNDFKEVDNSLVNNNTPEKQPWEERFDEIAKNAQYDTYTAGGRFCCGGDYCNGSKEHNEWIKSFISQLLKEERERIREGVEGLKQISIDTSEGRRFKLNSYNTALLDALQVINKEV